MRPQPVHWMLIFAAGLATASVTAALAQQPALLAEPPEDREEVADDQQEVPPPRLEVVERPDAPEPSADDPDAKKKIEQALRGEDTSSGGSDPVLDDVLRIIRRQGSVLDGTVLDSNGKAASSRAGETPAMGAAVPADPSPKVRRQAHVAELLLKTARRLEQLGPVDATRRRLVTGMRAEAARLLSQ